METITTACKVAAGIIALYGVASIVGGLIGYLKAGSVPSVAAGVPSGLLLLVCAGGVFYRPTWSLIGAIVIALVLVGFFASRVDWNRLGEFVQSSAGPRAIGMIAGGLLVVIASVIALATNRPS